MVPMMRQWLSTAAVPGVRGVLEDFPEVDETGDPTDQGSADEQNLGDVQIVFRKKFGVSGHEPRLTDGGAGLKFRKFRRTFFVTEHAHARADRAGSHQHDFLAGFFQRGDLRDELLHLRRVNQLPAVGKDAGAEFHDEARNGFE